MKRVLGMAVAAALGSVYMDEATEAGGPASGGAVTPPAPKKEREVVKVMMQDEREVEFVGKRKLLKQVMIDGSKVSVRFDFRNGETRTYTLPDSLLLQFAGHGASQKIGDETAGEDDVDDMTIAVDELIGRLIGPEGWSAKKEGGGFGGASVLVKALVEVTKKSIEEVKAFLKAQVDAGTTYQKLNDAFSEDDTVGPVIKRLKKEKAGDTKVDTKGLLGGLGNAA